MGLLLQFLFPIRLIILEYHFAQTFQSSVKSFSLIGFREMIHKLLQVRIISNHKSRNRNMQFSRLLRLIVTFIDNIFVETVAIHIIMQQQLTEHSQWESPKRMVVLRSEKLQI